MKYIVLMVYLLVGTSAQAQTEDSYRQSREGTHTSDQEIAKRVGTKVAEKMEGSAAQVTVRVKDGHVIFEGTVETGSQLYVIRSIAQKLEGIKSFENNVEVK
ncbi:MAG: BON domain-containing protein [Methylocystaceae bacterium]|nr:BON domain-containing protein [Methylocystaceae bacterium]